MKVKVKRKSTNQTGTADISNDLKGIPWENSIRSAVFISDDEPKKRVLVKLKDLIPVTEQLREMIESTKTVRQIVLNL